MIGDGYLWTAEEAAAEVCVEVATIYTWVRRGYLTAVGQRGKHKLFRPSDVFACEAARKRKHRRNSLMALEVPAALGLMVELKVDVVLNFAASLM